MVGRTYNARISKPGGGGGAVCLLGMAESIDPTPDAHSRKSTVFEKGKNEPKEEKRKNRRMARSEAKSEKTWTACYLPV